MDIKDLKASLLSIFFYEATILHTVMFLSWFEMIAGYMANLKVKFVCSTFGNEFNQK